jgi:hypothetical protein
MASPTATSLPYAQRERLRFVESTLMWEGQLQRARVSEVFGVAANHVTKDLREYETAYPNSLVFEPRRRAYVPGPRFKPRIASSDPGEYLALQLAYVHSGASVVTPWIGGGAGIPSVGVPVPAHGIRSQVLRAVLCALHQHEGVDVVYHSTTGVEPSRRRVWPHALVHTGVRWHVRGYDAQTEAFRQFSLGRMDSAQLVRAGCPVEAGEDADWNTEVTLDVVPHPGLNNHQRDVVARDFGMSETEHGPAWRVVLRRCLVGYFVQRYGLDATKPQPPRHRIVLRDPQAVRALLLPDQGA